MTMKKRKMHYSNKREESKIGKCIEGSTSKSNDIKLLCGQPNSSEQIDFKVVQGFSVQQFYNLDSSLHGKHYILRHNHQKRSILTHTKYYLTLKEWLERNTDNWCPIYGRWDVDRPTEEAKKLIQCILQAVYDLHFKDIYHGFLHHPENFFIERDHCKKIKLVYLAYEKMTPETSAKKRDQKSETDGVYRSDILAISNMIFYQILQSRTVKKYPKDLEDLYERLSLGMCFKDWPIIVDHPSLWHWKLRFNYIERVWMQFVHADSKLKEQMNDCLGRIHEGYDWEININYDTPLRRMLDHNKYGRTPNELLRYIRNVRVHYNEREVGIDPQTEVDYLEEQFIEHKITQVCEIFLVYLHRMVCILGIEI